MTDAPYFRHVRRSPCGIAATVARESWTVIAERCRMAVEAALPDASAELYFNLGPNGRHASRTAQRTLPHRAAWIVGPHDRPIYIAKETRDCDIVGIRLHPWMAEAVLGVPAHEVRNAMVDLEGLWGARVDEIRGRIFETGDPVARIAIVERAVAERAKRGAHLASTESGLAARLCHEAERDADVTIGELAARHGLTHRRLIELFERTVGLKPKAYHRVRRLRRVFHLIDEKPRPTWTTIAHRCGYFDQAHLINDFRQLTGVLPREYEATRSSVGQGFVPHVLASATA
ncbi:MAG TPA: helix-turn-helix transcriptional regulator [Gemmatimonadaceae bacterium]|nr:helix-turn-helix transcriptional regulator [Gemmatimonadaceae bacterium]